MYNQQTHAMDRRALAQAGIKLICHTVARAGQLSMHQSFRVWQLPLLEKRATEPLEHALLSEIAVYKESHREAMRDADHHARGLRAACLVEHTIRGAWCAHKQATMRVWAGVVRHRIIHRGAQQLPASPLNLASHCCAAIVALRVALSHSLALSHLLLLLTVWLSGCLAVWLLNYLFVGRSVCLSATVVRSNQQVARGQYRSTAECSQPSDGRDEPLVTLQLFKGVGSVESKCCAVLRLSARCKRWSVCNANSKPTRRGFSAGHSAPTVAAACSATSCASNEGELGGDLYANIAAREIQSAE